jgi:glutamyl-tRNA reductase
LPAEALAKAGTATIDRNKFFMAELTVIGLNHRTAPVEVREHLALPGDQVARLLRTFHNEPALEEAALLATCNRTELYCLPRPGRDPLDYFLARLAHLRGEAAPIDRSVFYRHTGTAAVRHLFRVASSLDSQIIGEHQILGQVKTAYHTALEARTSGFLLNKLFHWSFRAGKRVQTETELGRGSAGVATAAVELARQIFSSLQGRTVLLVGAGRTAEYAARALVREGAARLIVANRTLYRAQQLAYDLLQRPGATDEDGCAEACDDNVEGPVVCPALLASAADEEEDAPAGQALSVETEAIGLEDLPAAVGRADLVISSTGSPQPVLTLEALAPALGRRDRPVLIIDIAVPRDADERLAKLDNVFLYNIDDLDKLVERNLERRRLEMPKAEAIVEDEVVRFQSWLDSRQAAPTLRLLTEHLEALRQAHVARYGRKFTEADRTQLDQFTRAMGSQFLHKPVEYLKSISDNGSSSESLAAVDLVRRLFGLDSGEDEE